MTLLKSIAWLKRFIDWPCDESPSTAVAVIEYQQQHRVAGSDYYRHPLRAASSLRVYAAEGTSIDRSPNYFLGTSNGA